MSSNTFEQRAKDAQKELASSSSSSTSVAAASATGERAAASEVAGIGGDSFVASTSALDAVASSSSSSSSLKPATKRKYQRKKNKQDALPVSGAAGNQSMTELTGNKLSTTSMSSSESTEVPPKKKRRRAIELLTQFNPPDESRDIDENRLSRSATEFNASSSSATTTSHSLSSSLSLSSSSSILLQVPQFLQQTTVESSAGRRGNSTRRDGSIVRHARRPSNYDRNAAYEAELNDEAERRLVRRGHGRGCRAAARHQQRMLGSQHRTNDAELRGIDAPSASSYDNGTNHHYQQQQHPQSQQRVDDETTRDLFEYDDSSDAVYPSRRGQGQGQGQCQGRKPVRKNPGRIAFQYPEVFGRRRARGGGLRGRSRPVRGGSDGGGAGTADGVGAWDDGGLIDHSGDPKDFDGERTRIDGVTIGDEQRDALFSAHSIDHQLPTAAAATTAATTTSIRGKVRSRVRVGGRGSRGHSRTHTAPRYDPVPPPPSAAGACAGATSADSRPCPSGGVGRDTSETRLHQVTRLGYEELVSYYLTTGIIHPNVQDNSGVTPLHDSCSHGYLNITRLLLDHGAHPNCKDLDGTRPLHLAVANDRIEIVRLLLSFGADVTMTDVTGRSPLTMAKTRDMKQMLKGFASDLSGGKGKEIPWQFPAIFETGVFCDVLADAPSDDLNDDASVVIFDLGTDSSLPVHRFVSDSQKGPRNFHSVSDLCEDVKVDDFLLLNGDLTYVHVTNASAAAAADLSSSSTDAAASASIPGHSLPGPSSSSSSSSLSSLLSSASSLDHHHLPSLSLGASTSSSVSFANHQQQQQQQLLHHRGWMSLSSSHRPRTYCSSSATGADCHRSSYVEIDVSLKGLLDIGVHRVPLHFRSGDVTWPSSGRFFSRRKAAADNSRTLSTVNIGNRVSSSASSSSSSSLGASHHSSSVSLSSSIASADNLLHASSSKSELASVSDCTTTTTTTTTSSSSALLSGVEKQLTRNNCETGNEHNSSMTTTKLESKKKSSLIRPVSPTCLSSSSSSLPTARATPLPTTADPKGESGNNSRGGDNTLDQCRIVLCDIKGPSLVDLNSSMIRTCDVARKDFDKTTTVIHHRTEEDKDKDKDKDDRKKTGEQRKQTVLNNEHHTGSASSNSLPVRSTSVIDKTTGGYIVKASKDISSSASSDISVVPIAAASQRHSLGSSERGTVTNGSSSSSSGTVTTATVPHQQRPSVLSNARRRVAVPRDLVDGGVGSKPEVAPQSESLIPVLEKHGSDDETPPVENEEDVCGESYDDEREMPQLTLYA